MAEMLKRQYDLLALKIAMDLAAEEPRVKFELRGRSLVYDGLCAAEEIGLPKNLNHKETIYQGYRFHFPGFVLNELKNILMESGYQDRPLWLHLAKPLGYLNLVPWEQLLGSELQMPLLRLPDFLAKPPRESLNSLDVILCTSLPVAKDYFMAVEHVYRIAEHITAIGPANTTVHVFADHMIYQEMADSIGTLPKVTVYSPSEEGALPTVTRTTRIEERAGRIENPWLVWMRNALKGRSVDVAHFISHGYLSRDQGALAFAESPMENEDRRIARFVGASELLSFLTQIGAWAAAFSSPEGNYSEMGLRLLADTIAQMRPGPVVHHEMRLDDNCESLAKAYRFLFGRGSIEPPSSPSLFIYCHPSRVEQKPLSAPPIKAPSFRRAPEREKEEDAVADLYKSDRNVPSWIAATERYLELRKLDVERMLYEDELSRSTRRGVEKLGKNAALIQDTLRQVQETLSRFATKSDSGDDNV